MNAKCKRFFSGHLIILGYVRFPLQMDLGEIKNKLDGVG
jgi:hypothetical protein